MRLSNASRAAVVLGLFVVAVAYGSSQAQGRPEPGLPQRRLLNLSGNSVGHRRLLNLSGNSVEPAEVPESLLVAPGHELNRVLSADGVQEYVFQNGSWALRNATATLCTLAGKPVGEHFYLPEKTARGGQATWRTFDPESMCSGAPLVRVTVSPDSIPWLLVNATDMSGSPSEFGESTYVQRLYTENGLPPEPSISAAPGDVYKSPYTALYFFYRKG